MTEDPDNKPAIIKKIFGKDYTGPLSTFWEWHALEYGVFAGFCLAIYFYRPEVLEYAAVLFGVRNGTDMLTRGMRKQIKEEFHYLGVGAFVSFFMTVMTFLFLIP